MPLCNFVPLKMKDKPATNDIRVTLFGVNLREWLHPAA